MSRRALALLFTGAFAAIAASAQTREATDAEAPPRPANQTMKQLVRGTEYAATSMMPQATMTAERVLRAGGNAFDAIVAGQAVLGVVQPNMNGLGSDAVLLIYDAKQRKVISLNAEGTAPKLATIAWYKANKDGKIPVNDSLLSGTVPGVVDAWYIMLSHWGTKTLGELLAPAIELCERGVPMGRMLNSPAMAKYPTSARVYAAPDGQRWQDGQIWKNPDLAHTFRRLVEAEKEAASQGRQAALKAARDRFYKGDIAREMAKFSEENGGLFRYEDFANYTAKLEEPVSVNYHGYVVYKNASATQGPAELIALNLLEGYDLKKMGLNSADYIHTSAEAMKLAMADRDTYLGDMDFIKIPYTGLLSKEYAAERRKLIDSAKASADFRPGDVTAYAGPGYQRVDRPRDVTTRGNADHTGDTSYIAVVDRDRNMISFTPSLHSAFGTKVVMGNLGFMLNCRGDYRGPGRAIGHLRGAARSPEGDDDAPLLPEGEPRGPADPLHRPDLADLAAQRPGRVWGNLPGRADLHGHRGGRGRRLWRPEIRGADPGRSRRPGGQGNQHRPDHGGDPAGERQPSHRKPLRPRSDSHHPGHRPARKGGRLSSPHRRLSQRQAGAAGGAG